GGERPVLRDAQLAESGRGLQIVDALAVHWGHRPDGPRTTVWAEFPARVRR
ncbi:ATP-binding protein, partial [Actinomadura sp. 7K507]